MAITLSFEGFSGSPEELKRALRSGRVAVRQLPLLRLIEQALEQVAELDLPERGSLLPILAELLERKLRALLRLDLEEPEEDEDEGESLVGLLVELDEAVRFLLERAEARSLVIRVPPAELPRDRRLARLSPATLRHYAQRYLRPRALLPSEERFGVAEAWSWLLQRLRRARWLWFSRLGLSGWAERTVAFAALLEAVRSGQVRLQQEEPFADLLIELEPDEEQRTA
ncbi:chromosome segregation protein ScpA [Oceanithermus sp.]